MHALTLVTGLLWLEEGVNTLGGAASNTAHFEVASAPAKVGTVVLNLQRTAHTSSPGGH